MDHRATGETIRPEYDHQVAKVANIRKLPFLM